MISLREVMNGVGIDTGGEVSVLGDFFGFIRRRVPEEQEPSVRSAVSVLDQVRAVQGRHILLNVIRVGFDAIPAPDLDARHERLDYALYRMRTIYTQVNLGVGRVLHLAIETAEADGYEEIGSEDEADDLIADWSVPNDGIDVFVVQSIIGFTGKAADIPGKCDKESKNDGVVGGEIGRDSEPFARTFAHEVGHHLGLEHNHGGKPDCPGTITGCNNLMAQTRCADDCGGGVRTAVLLTSGQGSTMREHCSVRPGI
jgi:hypothetical protein